MNVLLGPAAEPRLLGSPSTQQRSGEGIPGGRQRGDVEESKRDSKMPNRENSKHQNLTYDMFYKYNILKKSNLHSCKIYFYLFQLGFQAGCAKEASEPAEVEPGRRGALERF